MEGVAKHLVAGDRLYSLAEALRLDGRETLNLYKADLNPGLAQMLGLLRFDRNYVLAQGVSVWDDQGQEYLDFLGGYGSLNFGHHPPRIQEALKEVMEAGRPVILQATLSALTAAAAHNVASLCPGRLQRVFFGNSGAEAVEGALKLARAYTGRPGFIHCRGSFHGKTFGALSVTGRDKYQRPFQPLLEHVQAVDFGDLQQLEQALQGRQAAAFIVEPIQGEGGVHEAPPGYLAGALDLCHHYGALLVVDEVQTGFGRTGTILAVEHDGVVPDILCLAKSLGGGMVPVGAFVTTPEIWDQAYGGWEKALLHTSTFGGNAMAMAAVIAATQELVQEGLADQAREKGQWFKARLLDLQKRHRLIREVRGRGLLLGVEFNQPEGWLARVGGQALQNLAQEYTGALVAGQLLERHHIITAYTLNNPNVIRLEPPLVVTQAQMQAVVDALDAVLQEAKGFAGLGLATARTMLKGLLHA